MSVSKSKAGTAKLVRLKPGQTVALFQRDSATDAEALKKSEAGVKKKPLIGFVRFAENGNSAVFSRR